MPTVRWAATAISANSRDSSGLCSKNTPHLPLLPRVEGFLHLACTVKAGSKGCQRHDNSAAVVAFDGVERGDAWQSPGPAQVLLQHVAQIAHVERVPVILHWQKGSKRSLVSTGVKHDIPQTHNKLYNQQVSDFAACILLTRRFHKEDFSFSHQCHRLIHTVIDDSLIFCSTISLAEKPSSRKEKSNSVFMVAGSLFDWSLINWKKRGQWQDH